MATVSLIWNPIRRLELDPWNSINRLPLINPYIQHHVPLPLASSGKETTTRLRCPMPRRKQSSNFLARSMGLRWLRSSLTWSQFPKTGTGMRPGGSLNFLPRRDP
ncbi:hypothetical protein DVH24_008977 [Malus domestica]|uniref:Uncharacterized protein n=1 Tax=Malus domestica TaxID=3750 RepID=A0A498JRG1_MALDO|nr:hypothetical protein DVH24_008977 [Malus domestica]